MAESLFSPHEETGNKKRSPVCGLKQMRLLFYLFCQMFSEVAFLDSRDIIRPKEYPGSRMGLDISLI